ncbi:tyrosine-type recombinase/integrase [Chitinophaga pendula]|nr:integrase [Chitinophaga sp. MD30]UCJ10297.1 tyrosine-type recombinase/integrase [Chitinophaga pendula]
MNEVLYPLGQSFLTYIRLEKRYSAHTVTAYENDLRQFSDFLITTYGELSLGDITHLMVRSWLAALMQAEVSPKSIHRKLSSLKSFFRYAVKQGHVRQTPMTRIVAPKLSRRLPGFIDDKGMEAVQENRSLRKGQEASVIFTADLAGMTHYLVFDILYHTGVRRSELIGLQERHIDAGNLTIKVLGKGNKERLIPISGELYGRMSAYMQRKRQELEAPDTGVLLVHPRTGRALAPRYVYELVRHYLSVHQLTTIAAKSPHVLRHTFATHLMNNGADLNAVKELLGHSSLAATQVYTHNSIEQLKDVFRKAHPKA